MSLPVVETPNSATVYKTFISISFHYVEINQVIQAGRLSRQKDRQIDLQTDLAR